MFAYSRGVNPCAIVRKSKHESEENIMNKGDKIEVNDKDVISLLPSGIYPMTFSIPESKTNIAKRNLDPDFSTPIPNKKPRLEVIQNEEDEKNKPMCKYGISCYQTNAEHRKKYRHGAAFDEDKNGVDNFKSKKREGSESEDDLAEFFVSCLEELFVCCCCCCCCCLCCSISSSSFSFFWRLG